MKKVFDFLDPKKNAIALTHDGYSEHAIVAVARAERALVLAVAERTYTDATMTAVEDAMDRVGAKGGAGRPMAEAFIEGRKEIVLQGPATNPDGSTAEERVSLRARSVREQAVRDYRVERACDALVRATSRFAHSHPELSRVVRRTLLADDAQAYRDLCALATSAVARRAISDVRRALTRAEHDLAVRDRAA